MDREAKIESGLSELESNPHDLTPLKRLEHEVVEDWEAFVDELERRGETADDPAVAGRFLLEAGRLASTRLDDADRAAQLVRRSEEAEEGGVLEPEARMYSLALEESFGELVGFFEQAFEAAAEQSEQSRLYLQMGSILEAEVGDLGEAAKSYQYSQQLASGKRPAVWARQSLARRREEWSKLGDLYAEELEVTDDRGRSVELYNKLGELAREQLGDEETAVQCFGYAYELDSTDERARTALVELGELEPEELPEAQEEGGTESVEEAAEPAGGESGGAVESAEEVEADGEVDEAEEQDEVDEEPEVAGDEESAPVETEADELPDDVDEVAEAELLDEDVEEISAESDLEEESSPPETPSDAPPAPEADAGGPQLEEPDEDEVELESDELEQAEAEPPAAPDEGGADESTGAEAAVDEEPPLEAPASQADAEPEEAPADDESVEIEADEIAGDESEAIEGAEEEELEEEVEGEEEVQPVDVTGGDRPGWPERCSEFVDRAEEADDPEPTAARLSEAARLHWLHGGGEEVAAMDLWRTAIESGAAEEFYDAARIYFRGEGTWSEIVEALEEADVAPSVLASASLFDLGDSERAASYLEGTEDEQLEQAVEDLGEAEGNWRRFQRSLEKRHRDLEGVEKAEAVYGYLADLARGAGAVDKEVDALRRYDRQVDDGAGDRLMVAYRAAEKWPMYVDLVKEHAESLDDERVADKVDWLEEAVRVYRDEMDHDMMVVNTYRDILEIDPENVAAVDALIDLYEEMNRSSELIDALQRKAELVEDDDRRIELYLEVAELFLDKFRNQAEAIEAYETILEIDPRHPEALEFLEEMYEKRRDWESLVDVRRRRAETLEDEDERIDALKEVAELASDRLRRTDVAAELWREIHDRRPDDPEALDALEELFEKGREWDELAGILELKTDHAEGEELFEQYQKLAQLYADRLDEPQRAVEAWRQALSIEPDDRKSRNALEQLYVDQRDWEALEAFYADRDEFRELARKYETLAGTLEAAEASVEVLLRAARVWREELDELGRAERALEQVLETDETNERAARRLEPLYRENEDAEGLREVLGILLEHADEVDERRQYQLQIARLHEEQLAEPDEAFDWYARAVEERPETDPVLDDLERAAGASERWGDLEEVYRSLLEGADLADDRRRDLRTRLGGVLFEHLDRGGDALEQFETILDEEPEHLGALAAVEEIHRSAERWDELLDVYQRRLELTEEPADRADILRGMAELAEEQKGDLQEAVDRLQEALSLEPSDTDTLAELQRLYRQREQWEDLAETLDAEIEVLEGRAADRGETEELEDEVDPGSVFPDELADTAAFEGETPAVGARYDEGEIGRLAELYARLGEVCREKLGCDGRAIEAFERAARWRPNLSEVRTGLEAYLDDDQWSVTAAELLGPIYEIHGDWTELTVALQLRAEQAPPAEAAQLYERLGRVQLEEIGEPEAAFAAYAEAAKMAPERDELREQLLQIADATDNWSRVADVLDDVVSLVDDPQLRGDYLLELAELADGRLDDLGRAESYYREYLEEAPEDREVLGALENVLERTEQWEPLLDVLEQQLELAKDAEALRTLRFRAAGVCAELLDRPERAIDFVEAAREDAPEDPEVLDALGRLYEETDRWRDLVDNAERQLELADEADEPAIRKRLAEVHHAELGEPVRAVDLLEEVVGSRPEDAEAIEQLESLIEVEGAPSTRIAQILEPLYLADESWDEMIAVLEVQVREADAPGERVHLLHRVAGLQEDEIDDPGAAFETYARALEDDVEDETTVDELYRLAEELDRWEELVEVFEERAELETDPEAIRGLLRRAAEIEVEQRDAYERAAPLLEEVAELFPSDLETLERLETIYRQLEDWDSLVETLRGRADREPDVDDQKELLYQAGEVADEFLDRPEQAVDVYREVLGLDPEDRRAIDRLEQLYTRLERWTDLLEIYQRKLKLVEDDQSRQDLLHAVGPLYEEELDQPYEAIDAYRSILDIDSEDLEAVEHLAELYEETEQWHELLDVLEHQLDLVSLEEERHAVRLEIGELWENELGDALRAVEEYEAILEEDPEHEWAREALAGLVESGPASRQAAEVLEPIYEEAEQWRELVDVRTLLVEASDDPVEQLELWREIAELYRERLDEPEPALEAYLQAVEVAPDEIELLDQTEALAAHLEDFERVVERYVEVVDDETDFEVVGELNRRIGRLLDRELDRPEEAIDYWERARDVDPEHLETLEALDRLYEDLEQWEELADVLRAREYATDDAETSIELRSRLGLLQQEALGHTHEAIDLYESILEDDPERELPVEQLEQMFTEGREPERIMAILEPHYAERGEIEQQVDLFRGRLEQVDDPDERFDLYRQIGQLQVTELDRPEAALEAFGEALVERPSSEEIVDRIEQLADETGSWERAAASFYDALETGEATDRTGVRLWKGLARILDEELDQTDDAEMAYRQALELEPGDEQALASLDDLYEQQQRWADLADILRRRIEEAYDEGKLVDLRLRLAKLLQHDLEALDEAVVVYRELLDTEPGHEEALSELEQIHRQREEWQDLYDVLQRRVDATMDPEIQAACYTEMARLAEERLDRPFDAVDLWNSVLDLEPDDRTALEALEDLYIDQERWEDLVEILDREVELADDPEERAELNRLLGTVWGEKLGNDGPALEAWREVLDVDPHDLEALRAARAIYDRQGNYEELESILERLVEHPEVDEELAIWEELAEIRGEMLHEPDRAIEAWEEVLERAPGDERALDELEQLYFQEGRWEGAVEALVEQAELADDERDQVEMYSRAAEIAEEKLEDRDRAADLYQQVLEADPSDIQAGRALERIYRSREADEAKTALVELYIDRAEVFSDRPQDRLEALRSAAGVFENELDQPDSALVALVSAFGPETADDEALRMDIERLAGETGLWEEAVEAWEETVRELGETPLAADLREELGGWVAEELDRPDDAIYHYRRALDIDPDRDELLEKLEDLLRELESWPELANVVEERIELTADPDEEIDLWRTLGEIYELRLDEPEEALDAYRQILEVDPSDLLALERLERIYESEERWEDLIRVLEQKVDATYDPDEVVDINARIAEVYEEELDQFDRAVEAWEDLLDVDPENERALESLEELYLESEQWDRLLDVCQRQLSATHDPEEQEEIHGKIASVYEDRLGEIERAIDAYDEILVVDPESEFALRNLERLYDRVDAPFDLVDTLQQHVEVTDDPDRKVELLNRVAEVQREEIDDPYAAIEALEESLSIDGDQPASLLALAELHEQTNNWERAVEAYEELLDRLDEPDDRLDVHCAVGEVLDEQLRDEKRAEEHFTEALDIDPGYEPARQALEELYERQTNWEGLVDLYLDASERTDDLGEKATFLARIGDVYEQELDDRQAALDYYERALEEDPTVVDAAEPLAELYIDEDQIERAVPLLDRVIDEYEEAGDLDERELTDRHVRLAGLYEEIAHFEQALEHFERALDLDPENVDVLLGLGRVLYELGDFEAAAECYDALEQDFAAALETEELLDLYARSGHTHEELGEPDVALDYYERALELDGYNKPSLEALVDLHEELGNWEEVVEYNRRLIEVEEDNEIRFAKLTRNGEIFREEIGDLDRAVEAYSDALDLRPSSVAVLRELLQIYRSTDQWHAAVDILDRLIEQQDDPEREAYFCYTTGVLYRDKIGDGDTAIEYFDRALDANLQKLEAFEAIDRLLTDRKDWKELERAYRRMLHRVREHEGEVPDEIKFKLWEGLGEIYRSRLGHPKSAIKAFETAAELRPESEKIRLILADLHEQVGEDTEGRIEQHRKLLENDPYRIESYEALFDAYYDQGAYDRAWCFAGALTYLEKANDRQREFYDRYLEGGLDRADRTMGEDAFDKLYYPDQDRRINAIMSVLNQGLRDLYADDIRRDWGFEPETDQMDLSSGTLFANLYQYVAETVDIVPVPKVYAKRDQALGLRNANVQPPSIVAGADVVQTRNERELTFRLGKLLGAMRREHYLASIGWPTEFLKMMFMAGMHVTNPDLGIGEQLGDQGQTIASEIENMPSQMQMELRKHMTEYLKRGENPNLTVWKKHVEHTTNRLGLLLCGDLRRAAAVVKNDQSPISKATVKEKVRELLLFSISDEYHVLRRRLGLSIEE